MDRYRSGHNGPDSKFLEAPAVSSAENVRRTGLCAGSDFTISYRSCVFFLHSSGAGITLEVYGELSERSKVRHSKCRVPKRNLGFESLTLRHKSTVILIELRWAFSIPENRLESGFSTVRAHKRTPLQAILRQGFVRFRRIVDFCAVVIVKQLG